MNDKQKERNHALILDIIHVWKFYRAAASHVRSVLMLVAPELAGLLDVLVEEQGDDTDGTS